MLTLSTLSTRCLTALALGLLLLAGATAGQDAGEKPADVKKEALELKGEGPWIVRLEHVDRETVVAVAGWLDILSVHAEKGYLLALVHRGDADRLRAMGLEVKLDVESTDRLRRVGVPLKDQTSGIPGFPCYRTVEETFATAEQIVAGHPGLATWTDVGDSWEKTQDPQAGWDLMVLKLTQSAVPGPKPVFFATCAIHAREYATAELCTRFAEELVAGYGNDADATWILDHHEVHLLLVTNPDGRKKAETGLSWRKNTNNDYCSNTNSRGADLNRNFDFQWGCCGGSSGNQCDSLYRGPSPASEPELQALQAYVQSIFPDQRVDDLVTPAPDDATGLAADIHAHGELVMWSWSITPDPAPNATQLQTLGRKLAYYNGHEPKQGYGLYPADGTSKDYYYGTLGIPGILFELGTTFFESCSYFESSILPGNLPSLRYAAKVARTPYLTPAGPEAYGVAVPLRPFAAGDMVLLTATVDDTRYSTLNGIEPSQTIAAAEVYVDLAPWEPGALPLPMVASDGTFDATSEGVEATIDTTGFAAGRHILLVRGIDANGNVGAASAVFLDLIDPASAPVIQGLVRTMGSGTPLAATVTIGDYVTTSDPGTGFYSLQVPAGTYDITAEAADHLSATAEGVVANDFDTVQQNFDLIALADCDGVDFESGAAGWTNDPASTCSTGSFVVGTPTEMVNGGVTTQVGGDHTSGTGNAFYSAVNTSAGSDDIDGGECIVTSPVYSLTHESSVSIWTFHGQRDQGDDAGDFFFLEMSTDGGTNWSTLASYGDETVNAAWTEATATVPAGSDVRFRVRAADGAGAGDLVEAGVDDLLICPTAPACIVDADCDDGLYCNGVETCNAGTCAAGTPVACDDGVSCTADVCNEATDSCDYTADDGLCDDGEYCTGAETCDPVLDCQPGTPVVCDDGVACTVDACDEVADACGYTPDDAACQDAFFCNGAETCDTLLGCQPGSDPCPGEQCDEDGDFCVECTVDADCDDTLYCNGVETCNGGVCQAGTPVVCDDGIACTVGSCNETTDACDFTPDDGLCDNGLYCDGAETCDALLGCQAGTAVTCDDAVACTNDSCNETTDACEYLGDDAQCANGVFCDGTEVCNPAVGCETGTDPCPGQLCDEGGATCVDCFVDGNCDDTLFCNGAETCVAGVCQPGSDPCPGQTCDEAGDTCIAGPVAQLEWGTMTVGGSAVTVPLAKVYLSPVVVTSVQYSANTTPVITRISNVTPTSFDVRLQSPSGGAVAADTVGYLVVEEGVWTIDGVAIEAWTYTSTVTDTKSAWVGEVQSYGQSYTTPVVLGQVMSSNDPSWSVFWDQGASRTAPPSATALATGKTVCEDPDTTRADETLGVVVIEAGHGTIGSVEYEAALGADTVRGPDNTPPYTYTFATAFVAAPAVAVVTMAGMDGNNGGWAYTHGPALAATFDLLVDEDQVADSERKHTTEQVGYVVFAVPGASP